VKIIVSVKQVPARDSNLRVAKSGRWLDESDLTFEINEPDAYALEEALQLKEKLGGEVVVLCAGPERAGQTIREALAKGADRAIHVQADAAGMLDSFVTAGLLAKAIEAEAPDLILTGLQSDDLGYGQTGVIMAELLGWPHATIVMEVEAAANGIRVKRELEDGWFQHVALPLPAVLTIQSGIKKLRYATLMGIKRAKSKEVKIVDGSSLGIEPASSAGFDRIYTPERRKSSQLFTGDARQAASQLVEKLRFEARVL
jgi:electron transfer flavoprotein beta subunit